MGTLKRGLRSNKDRLQNWRQDTKVKVDICIHFVLSRYKYWCVSCYLISILFWAGPAGQWFSLSPFLSCAFTGEGQLNGKLDSLITPLKESVAMKSIASNKRNNVSTSRHSKSHVLRWFSPDVSGNSHTSEERLMQASNSRSQMGKLVGLFLSLLWEM